VSGSVGRSGFGTTILGTSTGTIPDTVPAGKSKLFLVPSQSKNPAGIPDPPHFLHSSILPP